MQYFRDIKFETKYILEELWIKIKHPTRKGDMWYHWSSLWNHVLFHPWYCLKRGIRNLWVWFPLIWHNDVFDHYYLTSLMDKQMKEMEDFWNGENTYHTGQKHVAKRITWTRKLYKLWMDDYYTMLHYESHKQKYPDIKGIFEDNEACDWDEFGIPTIYETKSRMSEEESDEYRTGSAIAHKKDKKVFALYIKNISRCREWWD